MKNRTHIEKLQPMQAGGAKPRSHANRTRTHVAAVLSLLMLATACGKGSSKNIKIDGVVGPTVNYIDNKFTLAVVLKEVQIDFGTRIPIPYLPNSFLEVGPDFQTNGYLINLGLDPKDIIALAKDHLKELDPNALPGGRPLPGVAAGELPSLAVQVPKLHDVVFYVGEAILGLFVPVNLPWKDYMGTYRFYDGSGDPIGNISVVGKDKEGANSGFLLLINLKGKVGTILAAAAAR